MMDPILAEFTALMAHGAAAPADAAVPVQRDRHLDHRRAGHRPGVLGGAPAPAGPVRRLRGHPAGRRAPGSCSSAAPAGSWPAWPGCRWPGPRRSSGRSPRCAACPAPGRRHRRPGHPARRRRRALVRRACACGSTSTRRPGGCRCPTYPFERRRYWIDPDPEQPVAAAPVEAGPRPLPQWFAVPVWRQAAPLPPTGPLGRCLVLDRRRARRRAGRRRCGPPAPTRSRYAPATPSPPTAATGCAPASARTTRRWSRRSPPTAAAGPAGARLHAGRRAGRHRHRGRLGGPGAGLLQRPAPGAGAGRRRPDRRGRRVVLDLVTAGTGDVSGDDLRRPEHATLAGLARVLPAELPGLAVRLVDADPADDDVDRAGRRAAPPSGAGASPAPLGAGVGWPTSSR